MKILIIDDSTFICKSVAKELKTGGYEVNSAGSGEEAEVLLADTLTEYSLIILDVSMPGKDGYEVFEDIQKLSKSVKMTVPIIFFTSNDKIEDRAKGYDLGALDFLSKDFEEGELLHSVNKILRPELIYKDVKGLMIGLNDLKAQVVTGLLEGFGLELEFELSGLKALETLKDETNEFGLIIVDQGLYDIKVEDLIVQIRKKQGDKIVPIIILTHKISQDDMVQYFRVGVTDLFEQPLIKEEFDSKIDSFLNNYVISRKLKGNIQYLRELIKLKDGFLSILSHDLKSPLTGIFGFCELGIEEAKDEDLKKYFEAINNSAKYLYKIITQLLDLRSIDLNSGMDFEEIEFSPFINRLYETLKGMAVSKEIQTVLNIELEEGLTIDGNELALKSAFNNIFSNAISFTPRNGKVDLCVKKEGEFIEVSINDTGGGISEAVLENIFDSHSLNKTYGTEGEKGSGLGLKISKFNFDKHGWAINIEVQKNVGTRIIIKIPFPVVG